MCLCKLQLSHVHADAMCIRSPPTSVEISLWNSQSKREQNCITRFFYSTMDDGIQKRTQGGEKLLMRKNSFEIITSSER